MMTRGTYVKPLRSLRKNFFAACLSRRYHIPPRLVVGSFSPSLISSRREDLQIEPPVSCRQSPSFHFYATLPRMLGATLIGHQVVQVCQPREKRLLVATGMMEPLHREELPLNGVVGLV
jgi:hypothetical protein